MPRDKRQAGRNSQALQPIVFPSMLCRISTPYLVLYVKSKGAARWTVNIEDLRIQPLGAPLYSCVFGSLRTGAL